MRRSLQVITFLLCGLVVWCQPVNDLCNDAFVLVSSYVGTTQDATLDNPQICVFQPDSPNAWFKFNSGAFTLASLSLCSPVTNFDTMLYLYEGTCAASNCVFACDNFCGSSSEIQIILNRNTDYLVSVSGFNGATGDFEITLQYFSTTNDPINDQCETPTLISPGIININTIDNLITNDVVGCQTIPEYPNWWYTFTPSPFNAVFASFCTGGTVPVTSQNAPYDSLALYLLEGQCGSFTCPPLIAQGGLYSSRPGCAQDEISTSVDPETQYTLLITTRVYESYNLEFILTNTPVNNFCSDATNIPFLFGTFAVNLVGATCDLTSPLICRAIYFTNVWYWFNSADSNHVLIDACGPDASTTSEFAIILYQGYDSCFDATFHSESTISEAGCIYGRLSSGILQMSDYLFEVGSEASCINSMVYFELISAPVPDNDECSNYEPIPPGYSEFSFSTQGSSNDGFSGTCGSATITGGNIWYSFLNDADYTLEVATSGTNYPLRIALFFGDCLSLTCIVGSTSGFQASALIYGERYFVVIGGIDEEQGSGSISFFLLPPVPPNDLCEDATQLASYNMMSSSLAGASLDDAVDCGYTQTYGNIWYSFSSAFFSGVPISIFSHVC